MRRSRLIALLGAVFFAATALGIFWLSSGNQAWLQGPIENAVRDATGRRFTIDGQFDAQLGRQVELTAAGLSLGNPDWAETPDMIRASRLRVALDLWSLVRGPVIIKNLEIDGLRIGLIRNDEGRANWEFGEDGDAETGPLELVLESVRVDDAELRIESPALVQPGIVRIDQLQQALAADELLETRLDGTANGRAIAFNGRVGPFRNLIAGRDLRFELDGRLDTLSIKSSGLIDNLARPARPTITLEIRGPDIDDVRALLGVRTLGSGDLDLRADLAPMDDAVVLRVLGNIGGLYVDAAGEASDLADLEQFLVRADASGKDLGNFAQLAGIKGMPNEPFLLSLAAERSGPNLRIERMIADIAEARFNLAGEISQFPTLDGVTLNLQVNGSDIARFRELAGLPGLTSGPFRAAGQITVSSDGLDVFDLDLTTGLLRGALKGSIGEPPDYQGTLIRVSAEGDSLQQLGDAAGISGLPAARFTIDGDAELTTPGLQVTGLRISVGPQTLRLDGLIGRTPLERDTELRFHATGPDAAVLVEAARFDPLLPPRPYDISGRVGVRPYGYRLDDVRAQIGSARVQLDGRLSNRSDLAGTDLRIAAAGPELEDLIADTDVLDIPAGPFDIAGRVERRADRIRVESVRIQAAGADIRADADIGWPRAANDRGEFDIKASGPDVTAVWPEFPAFQPAAGPFVVEARGAWRDQRWTIEDGVARLGGAQATFGGILDQQAAAAATDLGIDARIPDLSRLGLVQGKPLPAQPLDLMARFGGTLDQLTVREFRLRSGQTEATGSAALRLAGEVPDVDLVVDAARIDLRPYIDGEAATKPPPDRPPADSPGRLIRPIPLPLQPLRVVNGFIKLSADEVLLRRISLLDLQANAEVRDGALTIRDARLRGPSGSGRFTLQLVPQGEVADVSVQLSGQELSSGLAAGTEAELAAIPKFDIQLDLKGRGANLQDLAGSLNGRLRMNSGAGQIRNSALTKAFLGDFFNELLITVNPFVKDDPYTNVVCTAVTAEIRDGLLTSAPSFVAQTDKINIVSNGTVNLRTEGLDLNFKTAARRGLGISAASFLQPFVKVTGVLASPKLTLDPTGTLVSGGAALATAGLSIIATTIWDRAARSKDPCGDVLKAADKRWREADVPK